MDGFNIAVKYLRGKSHTVKEVKEHLLSKEIDESDVKETIKKLSELSYVDDLKYAVNYVREGYYKGKGKNRICLELYSKGVGKIDFNKALALLYKEEGISFEYKEEFERGEKLAKAMTEGKEIDKRLLSKVARKLEAQGYDQDIIYNILGQFMDS